MMIVVEYEEEKPFIDSLSHWIYRNLAPDNVIDIGRGLYAEALRKKEIEASGYKSIDGVEVSADLVLCLETTNDTPEEEIEQTCESLFKMINEGGFLIFSCPRKEYWDMLLTKAGFERMEDIEDVMISNICTYGPYMGWFKENVMFFKVPTK